MESSLLLDIAAAIMAQPTAPFHEELVRAEIRRQLTPLQHVQVDMDDFGNVVARYQHGGAEPRFAFAAHMDHPGYVARFALDAYMDDPGNFDGEFLGGVPEAYRSKNPPTRDFGAFSMWDLPAFEVRDDRIYSRACDDLIGCAAIVAMFHELENSEAEASCVGIFTRAEEVGFVGAIQHAKSGRLDPKVTVVSLEASSERGGPVKMGDGVIIRVGDRASIFDSVATAQLRTVARNRDIPHQRALMQGGTCEATAYQLYGYRTAGLCVALGNYHNCGPDEMIASEYVAISDAVGMADLCVAVASTVDLPNPQEAMREAYEARCEQYRAYF